MSFWERLFYAFCALCVAGWLTGWVMVFAEKVLPKIRWKMLRLKVKLLQALRNGLCGILAVSILTGCCSTGNVAIKHDCPPMLRAATYQAMQADELADYRIAVEKCQ